MNHPIFQAGPPGIEKNQPVGTFKLILDFCDFININIISNLEKLQQSLRYIKFRWIYKMKHANREPIEIQISSVARLLGSRGGGGGGGLKKF